MAQLSRHFKLPDSWRQQVNASEDGGADLDQFLHWIYLTQVWVWMCERVWKAHKKERCSCVKGAGC